ncbi:MAG TPA: hypothetical protein PLX45_20305 [Piscinibacter sp.]|jgi:hypothetical protein|nr:hypothetical protein [Piscinibacter sp.]HPG78781.1 hypothetical protein [Piscinibacter sp.]HPM68617.1 hypothetical protein [Piscinibacter sp.]
MASTRNSWVFVLVAAAILMVTMGTRQSMGLILSPLNTHTGLCIASIGFGIDPSPAADDRLAWSQLRVPACRLLHLRLSHRLPGHAHAGRGQLVRAERRRGRDLAGHPRLPGCAQ